MLAIELHDVWKRFYLARRERSGHLLELLPALVGRRRQDVIWALRGVSLSVQSGETVAIVGPNGSGKSTLLRIITGVIHPLRGQVAVRGKVCPLIELGAGFHHDLTGRDNVYLGGAVLGLTRREIRHAFDSIVDFAGVHDFMDAPLRHLSTGMQLRLAFSVAIHASPEVLVVDEVLAVGDVDFQRKCFEWLSNFQRDGGTLVFVSHDPALVARLSHRIVHLEAGKVKEEELVDRSGYSAASPGLTRGEG